VNSEIDTALLIEAIEANARWFKAENETLGSFHDRMNLCSYSEFMTAKALAHVRGEAFEQEWQGVPRFIITLAGKEAKT
jgi:hypothetical protein